MQKAVQLRATPGKNQGVLGVQTNSQSTVRSTWSAPIVGVGTTIQFSVVTLTELGKLVGKLTNGLIGQLSGDAAVRKQSSQQVNEAGAGVAGPIGILGVIFPAAQKAGLTTLLFLMGIISLTLAVMNALPIPALDGGRLFVTLLFRALKKPLRKETEEKIHGAGFSFLMLLVVVITVADVSKFF
jgi:regulator of sigma E protease